MLLFWLKDSVTNKKLYRGHRDTVFEELCQEFGYRLGYEPAPKSCLYVEVKNEEFKDEAKEVISEYMERRFGIKNIRMTKRREDTVKNVEKVLFKLAKDKLNGDLKNKDTRFLTSEDFKVDDDLQEISQRFGRKITKETFWNVVEKDAYALGINF